MIKRDKLEKLVERVLVRIYEAGSASYSPGVVPPDRPTVPAMKSSAEQEMSKELTGMNTRNPKAAPPSQKSIKLGMIRKSLDKLGFTQTPEGAKKVNTNLSNWYDQLEPGDALVSSADELAQRFSSENG